MLERGLTVIKIYGSHSRFCHPQKYPEYFHFVSLYMPLNFVESCIQHSDWTHQSTHSKMATVAINFFLLVACKCSPQTIWFDGKSQIMASWFTAALPIINQDVYDSYQAITTEPAQKLHSTNLITFAKCNLQCNIKPFLRLLSISLFDQTTSPEGYFFWQLLSGRRLFFYACE